MNRDVCYRRLPHRQLPPPPMRPRHKRLVATESVPGAVATGSSPGSDDLNGNRGLWRNCVTRIESRDGAEPCSESVLIEVFPAIPRVAIWGMLGRKIKGHFNLKELKKSMFSKRARMWLGLIAALSLLSLASSCKPTPEGGPPPDEKGKP